VKNESIKIDTPLGEVEFIVSSGNGDLSYSLSTGSLYPVLPDGMAISECHGVLLNVSAVEDIEALLFESKLLQKLYLEYSPESGEGLDAQSWQNENNILMIGTEDQEYLSSRLSLNFSPDNYSIKYDADGLIIQLPRLKKGNIASFHFVVAWNQLPEPQDCSCWYAVDYNHSLLQENLAKISQNHPAEKHYESD